MSPFSGDDSDFRDAPSKSPGKNRVGRLVGPLLGACVCLSLIALLGHAERSARSTLERSYCAQNLKQITLALNNYVEDHGALPPAYTVDANGRPLHSWRTLILPYLEEGDLYKSIDLSRPWNDPVNAKAFEMAITIYDCPSLAMSNKTVYRASVGPHSFLLPTNPRPLATITDRTPLALSVTEVAPEDAVPWMAPEDADEDMILKLGRDSKFQHGDGMNTAFADGTVMFLGTTVAPEARRAMISVDGDQTVSHDQFR